MKIVKFNDLFQNIRLLRNVFINQKFLEKFEYNVVLTLILILLTLRGAPTSGSEIEWTSIYIV